MPGADRRGDPRVADVRARLEAAHTASERPTEKAAAKLASQHKLYVRDRIALLVDDGSFVEDGRYANSRAAGLPADGVVTGRGTVDGRPAWSSPTTPPSRPGRGGRAPSRRSCGPPRPRCARSFRSSGWSTAPGPGSPTRSRCSRGGAGPAGSSTTRSRCRARCRRSAACSARRRPAGPTSPLLRHHHHGRGQRLDVPRRRRGWPRWSSARRSPSRRWAAPGCTAPSRASATCSPHDDTEAIELARLYFSYLPGSWRTPLPTYHRRSRRSR